MKIRKQKKAKQGANETGNILTPVAN